jgi:hypothetical protein
MERWAIHIDIEGFSTLWDKEDQVLWSLGELMRAIFRIGRECYPVSPERIFAHQLGDGFLIISDFGERSLERAITITVALMQHVGSSGRLAKAAIAEGELADIQGCYPEELLVFLKSDHTVSLGMGLMTIFPVMGTALIRSVALAKASPRGPLVTIEHSKAGRIPPHVPVRPIDGKDLLSVDWVHMNTELLKHIQSCARLSISSPEKLEAMLVAYCGRYQLPKDWVENTKNLLGVGNLSSRA